MSKNTFKIPFDQTGYFSELICDYLSRKDSVKPFYGNFPDLDGFKKQIDLKTASYPENQRKTLVNQLIKQYKLIEKSDLTSKNISSLGSNSTFTVVTGHQLNLFTGPLYFLYKIISTINLTKRLKKEFPSYNFVPIYWMATEDHDFEEIQFFNYKGHKIYWQKELNGAVGRFDTGGLDLVLEEFSNLLGKGQNADDLKAIFKEGYLNHDSLTEATRYIANHIFKNEGLVIVDGDDKELKRLFIPYIKDELLNHTCEKYVLKTNQLLTEKYFAQVNPREINLFYLDDGIRERIIRNGESYEVLNTDIKLSKSEILQEVDQSPEKFSPNVLTRPLYQEVILPNLAYIGGGGELAYWLELKSYFDKVKVTFPILHLRNSVMLVSSKQLKKMRKLDISVQEIFNDINILENEKVKDISSIDIDLNKQKTMLSEMFSELKKLSDQTDQSFSGAVYAQEKKQLNGIKNLEKRLIKAQKRKYKELVDRINEIKLQLFPGFSLQERNRNFSEFYEEYGDQLIKDLIENLDPLDFRFLVIEVN